MGLLDGVLGGLLNQQGGENQSGNIIGALLGGANQQGGAAGGIGGVLETLAANGMADHVASWLGDGHNLPISTDQLRSALGNEQVQQMASSLGLPVDDFLKHVADHLPAAAAAGAATPDDGASA
ncbi:hypothetical protein C5708_04015 [Caulobacter sp. CCUG 60055]|nr:YidB family protein [Caulobacter sp. CCUG 60055]MBQ1542611.1 DUF937 domain-containing protein [Caulobacteraceae bacterium]MCI3179414.1 hypothetical protein [Caulobacter sp. CCUG 60055]